MTLSDWVWLTLGVVVAGWEARGIIRQKRGIHERDTMSEYVWAVGNIKYHRLPIGKAVVATFLAWLAYHFLTH